MLDRPPEKFDQPFEREIGWHPPPPPPPAKDQTGTWSVSEDGGGPERVEKGCGGRKTIGCGGLWQLQRARGLQGSVACMVCVVCVVGTDCMVCSWCNLHGLGGGAWLVTSAGAANTSPVYGVSKRTRGE